jgi:hypothetical protein
MRPNPIMIAIAVQYHGLMCLRPQVLSHPGILMRMGLINSLFNHRGTGS